jgi:hypothetical protein
MPALQLIVTDAGRAALVNAAATGTLPVVVTEVGVTASTFTAAPTTTALPGEIKRMPTVGGVAVGPATIHVTIRDASADAYAMRAFALYLADGTLFAVYSQAGIIVDKSTLALLLLAVDVKFVDVDVTSIEFGDAQFSNPPATTTTAGVIRTATDAEAITGTAADRAVTPANLNARFGAGAPSTFVKGLLNLATQALFRAAIGLGNAAVRNEGAGGNLDADKLDGQHGAWYLDWNNFTNKPTSFPVSWTSITGKPITFPPSAHVHAASDITSGTLANARIAAGNVTQHQAALSIGWSQLTGVPTTFTPSAHTHIIANVTGLQTALDSKANISGQAFTGAVSAPSFNTSSSLRYKHSVGSVNTKQALALVEGLRVVNYRLKAGNDFAVGVIAEELAGGPLDFAVIRNRHDEPEAVNYQALFMTAVAALQQLAKRVDALEAKA